MSRPGLRVALAVAIQFLLLLGLLGFKQYTLLTGETVLLQVQPIDPRDLFRGDYVTLSYDISTLRPDQLAGDDYFGPDDRIYVELVKGDPYWRPVAIYQEHRQEHEPSVVLKGRVESGSYWGGGSGSSSLQVKYGTEDIFIPEDTGRAVESLSRTGGRLGVEVVVDRWGNGIARHLILDGETYKFERR